MNVAIIPARGASKRIPNKNIRQFCGLPMIEWSIKAALDSGVFDRILVSTDDPEIAATATSAGAEAPFLRPPELADDHTPTVPVIRHALDWLEAGGCLPEFACCLYATAPFVTAGDLSKSLEDLKANPGTAFVISATEFTFPIFRALKIGEDGSVSMFWPEHELTRSQDLEPAYHDAGQFYWGSPNAFREHEGFFNTSSRLYNLPSNRVHDIDSPRDWERAEIAFKILNSLPTDE